MVICEDGMWLAEVPGVPGAHAYAADIDALRTELIDAIALSEDRSPDQIEVELDVPRRD